MTTSSQRPSWASPKLHYFQHEPLQFEDLRAYTLEGIRLYENAEGILFPSVTHALGDDEDKKDSLNAWRQRIGLEEADRVGRRAASIGTRLHTMCERFLDNDPQYTRGAFPEESELFAQIRPVLADRVERVYAQEFPLYSLDLGVAGRSDLFCQFSGARTIVDFKSSSKPKRKEWITHYFMQATAYGMMIRERTGVEVPRFAILIASPQEMQVFEGDVEEFAEQTRDYFKSFHAKHGYTQQRFREMLGDTRPDERES